MTRVQHCTHTTIPLPQVAEMLSLMNASEAVLLLASLSDVHQSVVTGELSQAEKERLMLVGEGLDEDKSPTVRMSGF